MPPLTAWPPPPWDGATTTLFLNPCLYNIQRYPLTSHHFAGFVARLRYNGVANDTQLE